MIKNLQNSPKVDITSKFIKLKSCSPQRTLTLYGNEVKCLKLEDAFFLTEMCKFLQQHKFYIENQAFLIKASRELSSIGKTVRELYPSEKTPMDFAIPVSELVNEMIENKTPLNCIRYEDFIDAKSLTDCRQRLILLRKHFLDIPNGQQLLAGQELAFENLCKQFKIGRRTKAIIQKNEVKL